MHKFRFLKQIQLRRFSNQIKNNIQQASQSPQIQQDEFTKLIKFNPEVLRTIPRPLKFIEPAVIQAQEIIISFMNYTGFSLPLTIFIVSIVIRISVLPLMLVVQKKLATLADKYGFFQLVKQTFKQSNLTRRQKLKLGFLLGRQTTKKLKIYPFRILLMNISHFPFLLFTIFGLRRVIATKGMEDLSFLWAASPIESDPYYVLPFMACSLYYYNFGKGINPLNENTFFGRFKRIFQIFMIIWFPLLSQWPSAIQFYIMSNAIITLFQSFIFGLPFFIIKMNPKLILSYQIMQQSQLSEKGYQNLMKKLSPTFKSQKISKDQLLFNLEQEKKQYEQTLKIDNVSKKNNLIKN